MKPRGQALRILGVPFLSLLSALVMALYAACGLVIPLGICLAVCFPPLLPPVVRDFVFSLTGEPVLTPPPPVVQIAAVLCLVAAAAGFVLCLVQEAFSLKKPAVRTQYPKVSGKVEFSTAADPRRDSARYAFALMRRLDALCYATTALVEASHSPRCIRLLEKQEAVSGKARDAWKYREEHSAIRCVGKALLGAGPVLVGWFLFWLCAAVGFCAVTLAWEFLGSGLPYEIRLGGWILVIPQILLMAVTALGALVGIRLLVPMLRKARRCLDALLGPVLCRMGGCRLRLNALERRRVRLIRKEYDRAASLHQGVVTYIRNNSQFDVAGFSCFDDVAGSWENWYHRWEMSMRLPSRHFSQQQLLDAFRTAAKAGGQWQEIRERYQQLLSDDENRQQDFSRRLRGIWDPEEAAPTAHASDAPENLEELDRVSDYPF